MGDSDEQGLLQAFVVPDVFEIVPQVLEYLSSIGFNDGNC